MRSLGVASICLAFLLTGGCASEPARSARLSAALPFGVVDSVGKPGDDGMVQVSGWVLSEDPVYTVALYIDRQYVTSARMHQPRPDVNQAYPAFGAINPGWKVEFNSKLFPGPRELVVQARTVHDAVRDLRTWTMSFPN
jgi:hypothetical protein